MCVPCANPVTHGVQVRLLKSVLKSFIMHLITIPGGFRMNTLVEQFVCVPTSTQVDRVPIFTYRTVFCTNFMGMVFYFSKRIILQIACLKRPYVPSPRFSFVANELFVIRPIVTIRFNHTVTTKRSSFTFSRV